MASIVKSPQQEQALEKVNQNIATMRSLLPIINDSWEGTSVLITFPGAGRGKTGPKIVLESTDKDYPKVIQTVKGIYVSLAKETKSLVSKFAISLDEKEKQILGEAFDGKDKKRPSEDDVDDSQPLNEPEVGIHETTQEPQGQAQTEMFEGSAEPIQMPQKEEQPDENIDRAYAQTLAAFQNGQY